MPRFAAINCDFHWCVKINLTFHYTRHKTQVILYYFAITCIVYEGSFDRGLDLKLTCTSSRHITGDCLLVQTPVTC